MRVTHRTSEGYALHLHGQESWFTAWSDGSTGWVPLEPSVRDYWIARAVPVNKCPRRRA